MDRAVLSYRHIRHVPKAPNFWGREIFKFDTIYSQFYTNLTELSDLYEIFGIHFDKNTKKWAEKNWCLGRQNSKCAPGNMS
jgi:hypothetical protein